MLSRREWLSLTLATGAAAALDRAWLSAQQPLIMRAVPATNERLPIVGLGSSATFSNIARKEDIAFDNARALFRALPLLRERETLAATLENISGTLLEETDYRAEARMAGEVRDLLSGMDDVVVPRVHTPVSGERMIATDLLVGEHLEAYLAWDPLESTCRHASLSIL